ncbi:MAG: pyridoxine 5'-phosphate synthase, partial [Pseudomonadota bacterium]
RFLAHVPGVMEVSIGHALIADAIEFGLAKTIAIYQKSIADAA